MAQTGSRGGCGALAVIAVLLAIWVLTKADDPSRTAVSQAQSAPQRLSAETVAKCRALLEKAQKAGVIRARPEPNRINVEDLTWAQLPAETKDQMLQAVACDLWQTGMPGGTDYVVAYGYRSGKRIQMLTSVGMSRD